MERQLRKTDLIYDVYGCDPQFKFQPLCVWNSIAVVLEFSKELFKTKHPFLKSYEKMNAVFHKLIF